MSIGVGFSFTVVVDKGRVLCVGVVRACNFEKAGEGVELVLLVCEKAGYCKRKGWLPPYLAFEHCLVVHRSVIRSASVSGSAASRVSGGGWTRYIRIHHDIGCPVLKSYVNKKEKSTM